MLILLKSHMVTLNYKVEAMAEGHPEGIILDITDPDYFKKAAALLPYMDEDTVVVMFNGAGRAFLYQDGRNVWEDKNVRLYNYLVDHPTHYTDYFTPALKNENFLVIDRKHKQYINRYFPEAANVYFLPHGAPELPAVLPYGERDIPVLYIGSCQVDEAEMLAIPYFADSGLDFYRFVMERMGRDFTLDTAEAACLYLREKGLALAKEEEVNLICLAHMGVQVYMRRQQKNETIRALARSGVSLVIYGDQWEEVAREYPAQIKLYERVSPAECVALSGRAQITLNFMPYFKDGSHDRIYIAMLNKSLCFTDRSLYLEEKFTDGKDIIYFDHNRLDVLCDDVKYYLSHPDEAQRIIDSAYERVQNSKWSDRLDTILRHDFAAPEIV